MDGQENELYRYPGEEEIPMEMMNEEEVELRSLLSDFSSDPKNTETLIRLSEVLLSRQLFDEAWLYLDRYLNLVNNDPMAYNYAGFIRFSQGRLDEAEEFFHKALELDGNHTNALYNSAMLYMEQGDFNKAQTQFERLALIEDDNPEIFNNLGALLYQSGNLPGAEERFRQALAIDPEDLSAMENLMEILIEEGRKQEAREYLEILDKLNPPKEVLEEMRRQLKQDQGAKADPKPGRAWFPEEAEGMASPSFFQTPPLENQAGGLKIGLLSDWAPGDRGELAWWIRDSLASNGHSVSVLAKIGKVPHCDGQDRFVPPRLMGPWVVPDLVLSSEAPISTELYENWIKAGKFDAVIFVDETDPTLMEMAAAFGAVTVACPSMVGADRRTASTFAPYDGVVATTPWIYEALKEEVPPDKLIPSDLGIDLDLFSPSQVKQKETVFLFDGGFGSLEDLEGILSITTAFSLMNRKANEQSRLLIRLGVDWSLLPEEIRNRGEGHPRIDMVSGHLDNRWFLAMGDVLVHLRLSPGVHWIVPQAAASGVPSIILDKSPAAGWIYDQHMILKVPRAPTPGADKNAISTSVDVKTLADTMSTLASDREMLDYMSGICHEKSKQILNGKERSRVLCDKIVTTVTTLRTDKEQDTALAASACAAAAHSCGKNSKSTQKEMFSETGRKEEPEHLLNAIEDAIQEGDTEEARRLMTRYRQYLD